MVDRIPRPARYNSVNVKLTHSLGDNRGQSVIATYGLDRHGKVRAVFCASFKEGSEQNAVSMDGCKLLSLLLQHGYTPGELVDKLEGETRSVLGTIMRGAMEIENDK